MNSWILSVFSIVILTSLITLILPEGKLNKNIKSVFSLMVILVIIQPVLNLKNGEFITNAEFYNHNVSIQENYLEYIYNEKITNLEKNSQIILEKLGVKDCCVSIEYTTDEQGQVLIKKAIIDLQKAVFISNKEHIDIIEDITSAISEYLNIDSKAVIVYE